MAVATDVGGGTSFSMLRTMDEGYKSWQLREQRLNPFQSFYMLTLGNARALSMEDKIGTSDEGTEADIVVLIHQPHRRCGLHGGWRDAGAGTVPVADAGR